MVPDPASRGNRRHLTPEMNTIPLKRRRPNLAVGEIFSFAYETFMSNKVRFALTALGMVIGTASLILVTTIGLTGKQYLLNQIQAIGSNWVYAEYESGGERITNTGNDALTIQDMEAVQHQVSGIAYASPVVPLDERVAVGDGRNETCTSWVSPPNISRFVTCLSCRAASSTVRILRRTTRSVSLPRNWQSR